MLLKMLLNGHGKVRQSFALQSIHYFIGTTPLSKAAYGQNIRFSGSAGCFKQLFRSNWTRRR
jgi:hypothetical protein